jgi:hypothetical protein
MARKQPTNIDAQIEQLRNAPGVVSLTVSGAKIPPDWSEYDGPSRGKGKRLHVVPDARWTVPDDMLNGIESSLTVCVRIRTQCSNAREHHFVRHRRVQSEYAALEAVLVPHDMKRAKLATGCVVRLTRIGHKVDDDNLRGYLKHCRDYVAKWLLAGRMGERDSSPLIEWEYDQRRIGATYGVVVSIQPKEQA